MILRRVIAHLRNQEWTAIGIDFLIVVLGVVVGIQVSNLNSARIDRTLETEYVERIVVDLGSIIASAQNRLQFEQNKSNQVLTALAMTRQQPTDDKSLRLGHVLTAITVRLSPNFESSTFSDLQNSGRLSLIRNARLRTQLSTYFARLQYLRTSIGRNNDNYVETYVQFLRSEGIGAGYAAPAATSNILLSNIEAQISAVSRARFGERDIKAHSSALALPPSDPVWEKLRAQLSWRGNGAVANETLLNMIIADASSIKRDVERQQAADRN